MMHVMTVEGSWRGLPARVAVVSKALQSVLVRAGNVVVFGGGEGCDEDPVLNRFTGETHIVACTLRPMRGRVLPGRFRNLDENDCKTIRKQTR